MKKKERSAPAGKNLLRPVAPASRGAPSYPQLAELFAANPAMRAWVSTRLVAMARHAALAGVTVTALGCQHHDAPPAPRATLTPVAPPHVTAPTPPPTTPPTPLVPPAGQLAVHEGDPCPDHPGGTVVTDEAATKLPPQHRHRLHRVGGTHYMAGLQAAPDNGSLGL